MKYGFIAPTIESTDYFFGSKKLGSVEINPKGDWREFLPAPELQKREFDAFACVSFSITSCLEILEKFLYKKENNWSDRFLAKNANTDPVSGGTTPNIAAQALRRNGCVPELDYPWVSTLEEYYKEIPNEILQKGREFL